MAASLLGGGRGTLTLRSPPKRGLGRLSRLLDGCFPHSSGDLFAVLLAVLNRDASAGGQISVPLCLRVQREALLLRLTANFFGDRQLVRVDRSDRTLGEMRCGLDCFRLGHGGRVWIRLRVLRAESHRI